MGKLEGKAGRGGEGECEAGQGTGQGSVKQGGAKGRTGQGKGQREMS